MKVNLFRNIKYMNYSLSRKIALFTIVILAFTQWSAYGQSQDDNHFIYIQSKAKQPFYVILDKKVYSSSSIGYLIIPKLKDGAYNLRIGFPKTQTPEQNFVCKVKDADAGYSLQNDENGKLGLLNLQTQSFITSNGTTTLEDQYALNNQPAVESKVKETAKAKVEQNINPSSPTTSAFGDMLSDVANDPTLNKSSSTPKVQETQKQVVQSTEPAQTIAQNTNETLHQKSNSTEIESAKLDNNLIEDIDASQTFGVIKKSEAQTKNGTEMTFVLFNAKSTDTVFVLLPTNSNQSIQTGQGSKMQDTDSSIKLNKINSLPLFSGNGDDNASGSSNQNNRNNKASNDSQVNEQKFVKIDNNSDTNAAQNSPGTVNNPFYKSENVQQGNPQIAADSDQKTVDSNSIKTTSAPCNNPMTDKDLKKLEKKMISRGNDNEMIALVDKYIDGKCVTTEQVKQLGALFLSDAGRYALYHDAYSFTSDKENYASLQTQLLDDYFKKRFMQILQ